MRSKIPDKQDEIIAKVKREIEMGVNCIMLKFHCIGCGKKYKFHKQKGTDYISIIINGKFRDYKHGEAFRCECGWEKVSN